MKEAELQKLRNDWKPRSGSGKTKFNRLKKAGESWIKLRDEHRKGNVA